MRPGTYCTDAGWVLGPILTDTETPHRGFPTTQIIVYCLRWYQHSCSRMFGILGS